MIEDEKTPRNTAIAGNFDNYAGSTGKVFTKDAEGRYQARSVEEVSLPEQVMQPPVCDHHWVSHSAPSSSLIPWVQICSLCHRPNWVALSHWVGELVKSLNPRPKKSDVIGIKREDGTCSKCGHEWDEMHERREAAWNETFGEIKDLIASVKPVLISAVHGQQPAVRSACPGCGLVKTRGAASWNRKDGTLHMRFGCGPVDSEQDCHRVFDIEMPQPNADYIHNSTSIPARINIVGPPPVNNVLDAARAEAARRLMHEPWLRNG